MFRVVIDRYEFHSKDIQSKAFSFIMSGMVTQVTQVGGSQL